ncbi:hypothetical protein I1A_002781 [Pseudomonas fluorescens R124]|uniref:Uncharacterized protein n=1 Tax=Pseudomonas fluorescens R124 TaxID=743713 RepID=A0A7U9CN65_PSEFL|nr:hypothetical protein [Pseudomonas fluorescens]EJZ58453.1 hypothetical protein I1A_002781 [Pseudomonas fluorescens R124]
MTNNSTYQITVRDLYRIENGAVCGDEAIVAITFQGQEIDRFGFAGKCLSADGFRRTYLGRPGLTASLISGNCKIEFSVQQPGAMAEFRP